MYKYELKKVSQFTLGSLKKLAMSFSIPKKI